MNELIEKIQKHGQKRELSELEDIITKTPLDELTKLVETRLNGANFMYIWNYMLQGFTQSKESQRKRSKIVFYLLEQLSEVTLPESTKNDIVNRICVDFAKYRTEHLIELCNFCVGNIQNNKQCQNSWKELLPNILNVLADRDKIFENNCEKSGLEYKNEVITSLCLFQWSTNIVTLLASMFIDVSLNKEEHEQVVVKLGTYIEKLTPQELPAFVFQLLKLCKNFSCRSIFLRLQHYFDLRIYENVNFSNSSESPAGPDLIESDNDQNIVEVESTILFHINSSASLNYSCIKDYLSSLKNVLKSPEFIINPFQITLLLTLSNIRQYEDKIFESIRSSITRAYNEEIRKNNSMWFRDTISNNCKVESVFEKAIDISLEERELFLQGLLNFAFVLLGVRPGLYVDPITEKQWTLGNIILLKIIKRKRSKGGLIVQQLCNNIPTSSYASQYIECLYFLSKNMPLLLLENQSNIIELMETLVLIPPTTAEQLLSAIIPLTKVSSTIKDNLILILRKALYSSDPGIRQMAVSGFLKLLTILKISNLSALSQNSSNSFSSGHSVFTQISLNKMTQSAPGIFTNEALCLEVLSILRRCFMQQANVKIQLYNGLYDSVCENNELSIPALEMLELHFFQYYNLDDEILPPLRFNNVFITKDINVILQEPLGKLVHVMALILTKAIEVDQENMPDVAKFVEILENLCDKMANCELVHFELDDGTDLTDIVPESQQKLLILKEALLVYEALIGYKILSWSKETDKNAQQISRLFEGHCRLVQFSKYLHKPKKADAAKKKKNENTQADKKSQKTQKNKSVSVGAVTKNLQNVKQIKNFKPPDSILDFQTVYKALCLLYEPIVEFTTIEEANTLKSKKEFHRYILQSAIFLIGTLKNKKNIDPNLDKSNFNNVTQIAKILYQKCIKKGINELINYDGQTAILVLECFHNILGLVWSQFKHNLELFLEKIVDQDSPEKNSLNCLSEIVKLYQNIFECEDEDLIEDGDMKKISLIVINTIATLANFIPTSSNHAISIELFDWLKNYASEKSPNNKPTCTNFINLLFEMHVKFKVTLDIFEDMSLSIGDILGVISEEESTVENYKIVNEQSVSNTFLSLCQSIKTILEDIDWVLARIKSEFSAINYPGEDHIDKRLESLKNKEKGLSCQLCFLITILINLSNSAVQAGAMTEALLKNLSHLYNTLGNLAKYFCSRSSKQNPAFQGARFERVVKSAGKILSPVVYRLILYIEESQKETAQTSQSVQTKKKIDSCSLKTKVLKETRLIPKVVYEIEQFSKGIILLSNKTKIDLSKHVGQGTVRDFRIMHINDVLDKIKNKRNLNDTSVTTQNENTQNGSDKENDSSGSEEEEEASPPPSKKTKK